MSISTIPASPVAEAPEVINLRLAAVADDRELAIDRAVTAVGIALAEGRVVDLIWPAAREVAQASQALGLPLAQNIVSLVGTAAPGGAVVVHTRAGSADDFLALAPVGDIRFVMHLNAEEAALRWERGDASPGRRLAAAMRLRGAGWQVWFCVGPVRLFDGWRDEYTDLAERAGAANIGRLLITFPGEDLMEFAAPEANTPGVRPILTTDGCRFTVAPRQRREARNLLNSRIAPAAHNMRAA